MSDEGRRNARWDTYRRFENFGRYACRLECDRTCQTAYTSPDDSYLEVFGRLRHGDSMLLAIPDCARFRGLSTPANYSLQHTNCNAVNVSFIATDRVYVSMFDVGSILRCLTVTR